MKPPSHSELPDAPPLAVEPSAETNFPRPAYAWYVVGVLTLAYVFSFVDRQIIAFLIPSIRQDFNLGNFEIGLLQGTTFAIFYTFFGLPLGRMADTRSRRGLIAAGFVLWSLMTAASGLAQRFWHLLLCRTGVAVGEAALSPAAYSLITDYFPSRRRATAIGVYSFGICLGSGLSLVGLGLIIEFLGSKELPVLPLIGAVRPWQAVFFIVGLPGVLFALLLLTVREVPRHGAHVAAGVPPAVEPGFQPGGSSRKNSSPLDLSKPHLGGRTPPSTAGGTPATTAMRLRDVAAFLVSHRGTFLSLFLGMAFLTFAGYANSNWMVLFFKARHGWSDAQTGLVLGIIMALGGALGAVGGGRLADAWRSRGCADANLRVALLGAAVCLPAATLYTLAGSGAGAAAGMVFMVIGFSAPFALVAATVQQLAPAAMRAQASALFLFFINLIGMGLGPLVTGWLGRGYPVGAEAEWLPQALLLTQVAGGIGAVVIFASGLKTYRRTIVQLLGSLRPTSA
ncbi:MAG: MFS transporter [Verrucomicrobia bacterium]|nr:MFS transporter [Verrucomicrobiota bacterium]